MLRKVFQLMLLLVCTAAFSQTQSKLSRDETVIKVKTQAELDGTRWGFDVEIHSLKDSPNYQRMCCSLLDSTQQYASLEQYADNLFSPFGGIEGIKSHPASSVSEPQRKVTVTVNSRGSTVGPYVNCQVFTCFQNGSQKESRSYIFVYDLQHDKVLTVDDIFEPQTAKILKQNAGDDFISMNLTYDDISCGYQTDGTISFETLKFAKNMDCLTELFKDFVSRNEVRKLLDNRMSANSQLSANSQPSANAPEIVPPMAVAPIAKYTTSKKVHVLANSWLDSITVVSIGKLPGHGYRRIEYLDKENRAHSFYLKNRDFFDCSQQLDGASTINVDGSYAQHHPGLVVASCEIDRKGGLTKDFLYFDDGSLLSLTDSFAEGNRLVVQINGRPVKSRRNVAYSFVPDIKYSNCAMMKVYPDFNLGLGCGYKMDFGMVTTETHTYSYYGISSASYRQWLTNCSVDVPKDVPAFEKMLCKLLFGINGKSIATTGKKLVSKGRDKGKNPNVYIKGKIVSHQPGRYYSYYYRRSSSSNGLKPKFTQEANGNLICDLSRKRVMSLSDVLSAGEIASLGIDPKGQYDLGLDSLFLWVGQAGQLLAKYPVSQQSWDKFAPALQSLVGPLDKLPASIDEAVYDYQDSAGIQPATILPAISRQPMYKGSQDSLTAYISKHLVVPDSLGAATVDASFIVEADGSLSKIEVQVVDRLNTTVEQAFTQMLRSMPKWEPLTLATGQTGRAFSSLRITIGKKTKIVAPSMDNDVADLDGIYIKLEDGSFKKVERLDVVPHMQGGDAAMAKFLKSNLRYPPRAEEMGIKGRVTCQFVVERDGSITDVRVVRGVDPDLDREALRVIKSMPKWVPGQLDGSKVAVRMKAPINFILTD